MRTLLTVLLALCATPVAAQVAARPFGQPFRPNAGTQGLDAFQATRQAPSSGKSGKVATLLSLALPGAGELYLGSPKRAAGFLALEAFTWVSYFAWNSKGDDLKADFRVYADRNWNETRYREWQVYNATHHLFNETETLPNKETGDIQQYYEMIGKYDQFIFGWDDVSDVDFSIVNDQVLSPRRLDYEDQRNESNKYLKRASFVVGLAVLNRIASAFHASHYARELNDGHRAARLWVRLEPVDPDGRAMAAVGASF